MFDISKLPKPDLIKDYDLKETIERYIDAVKAKLAESGFEWDAANADPMTKVIKALAAMDVLRSQRTNETARKLLLAFAEGADLDNIRPDIERLPGGNTTADLEITFREGAAGILPKGTEFRGGNDGEYRARTFEDYEIAPDETTHKQRVIVEIYNPAGAAGNDNNVNIDRTLTAVPAIEAVTMTDNHATGSDPESDERYRERILLAPTSNMGGRRAYMYYALSADSRIKEVKIHTPEPGVLYVGLLPDAETLAKNNYRTAAAEIKGHVEAALSGDNNRPCADRVYVFIHGVYVEGIQFYKLEIGVHLLPGASQAILAEVEKKAKKAVKELYSFGRDITKNIVAGMCWVNGVSGLDITIRRAPSDAAVENMSVNDAEAAFCFEEDITVNLAAVDGGLADV